MGYSPRPHDYRRRWWHPLAQTLYAAAPLIVVGLGAYIISVWWSS